MRFRASLGLLLSDLPRLSLPHGAALFLDQPPFCRQAAGRRAPGRRRPGRTATAAVARHGQSGANTLDMLAEYLTSTCLNKSHPRHHKGNSSRGALKSRLRWLRAPATNTKACYPSACVRRLKPCRLRAPGSPLRQCCKGFEVQFLTPR